MTKSRLHADLGGLRVLLVEDEMLIAMMMESVLQEAGCVVVGPIGNVCDGLHAARRDLLDAAVLDINIRGQLCLPIMAVLTARSIPYVLVTGYSSEDLGEGSKPPLCCASRSKRTS
jgi:DNA-binding response OmpR family regulator